MAKKQGQIPTLIDARQHSLYCGVTLSGKTTLARHHSRELVKAGYDVAVYDPVGSETAGGGWFPVKRYSEREPLLFTDENKFLVWLVKTDAEPDHPIFVFVDESADIFGHENRDAHWLPRRVRHQNIYLRMISQRPKMLPPNVRTQCGVTYMFRLASDDAKLVCADAGHSSNVANKQLDTGDFVLLISGTSEIEEFNCFDLVD
jgi:hypothetical protein